MSFPDLTASDVLDPDFQDSLIETIAELTGIDASFISLLFGRRTASVTAQIQTASTTVAASASSAVTASVSSGAFTTMLNADLATTSYSGATVTAPTVTVYTVYDGSSSSSSEFYEHGWFVGLCAGVGFLLLGAIVAAIVFVKRRNQSRSLKEFDNVGVGGHMDHEVSGIVINASGSSPKHSSSLSMKPDEQPDSEHPDWDHGNSFVGKQDEFGLEAHEIEMSGLASLASKSDDHALRETYDDLVDASSFEMQSEDIFDLNVTEGEDEIAVNINLEPKHNTTRN